MQMLAEALLSLLLDYRHASNHLKRRQDSKPARTRMTTHIKALRWMALKLDLPLCVVFQCQTVSDFLNRRPEFHLKPPYSSCCLSALGTQDIIAGVITVGSYSTRVFLDAMASLRFRDLLRTIKPESLSIPGHILRGISWRAKASVSGQLGVDKSREKWGINWNHDFILDRFYPVLNSLLLSPCAGPHTIVQPISLAFACAPVTGAGRQSLHSRYEIYIICSCRTTQH